MPAIYLHTQEMTRSNGVTLRNYILLNAVHLSVGDFLCSTAGGTPLDQKIIVTISNESAFLARVLITDQDFKDISNALGKVTRVQKMLFWSMSNEKLIEVLNFDDIQHVFPNEKGISCFDDAMMWGGFINESYNIRLPINPPSFSLNDYLFEADNPAVGLLAKVGHLWTYVACGEGDFIVSATRTCDRLGYMFSVLSPRNNAFDSNRNIDGTVAIDVIPNESTRYCKFCKDSISFDVKGDFCGPTCAHLFETENSVGG